jgi:hypothetical protein
VTRHARDGGRTRGSAEDQTRPADVGIDGGLGDPEKQSDLLRLEAAGDGAQDLTLTIGQRSE